MTRRDLAWRAAGASLFITGCTVNLLGRVGSPNAPVMPVAVTGLLAFVVAVLGIVLLIQGKRIPNIWKVERGRHRDLPIAIHQRRIRSRAALHASSRRP